MRCIFSHGNPQKTLDFGAMRVDRTPQKSSDFNISIPRVKGRTEEECIDTKKRCEDYLFSVLKKARGESSQMTMDYDLFLTAQSFYACAVKIIGSVAACVACKYSDAKLSEKADKEIMKEIKQANKAAWEEIATAASPMSQTIPTMDVTSDDISGLEPEQTTASVAPSTGLTQHAWKGTGTAASPSSQLSSSMDVTSDDISGLEPEQTTASVAPSTGLTADLSLIHI